MATKVNSKLCQTSEKELFPQIVTAFKGELKILSNMSDGAFCKKSHLKSCSLFLQKPPSWLFEKVLNMLLNWLPKLRIFHF